MAIRFRESVLSLIAAGLVGGAAESAAVKLKFDKKVINPGEQSSWSLWIDASDLPQEVHGIDYRLLPPPQMIDSINGWDYFNQGGWFIDGFWEGKPVEEGYTYATPTSGGIGMDFIGSPGPIGNHDEVIRYFFTVKPNATFGQHSHSFDPYFPPTLAIWDSQNQWFVGYSPPYQGGSVTVAPSVQQMANNLNGPNQAISDPRYDRDGDGDMDLRDLAEFQRMYTD